MNELTLKRQALKEKKRQFSAEMARDILITIVGSPTLQYILGMLLIEYLRWHGHYNKDKGYYVTWLPDYLALPMEGGMTAAFVGNALGGLGGIAQLIAALKGGNNMENFDIPLVPFI